MKKLLTASALCMMTFAGALTGAPKTAAIENGPKIPETLVRESYSSIERGVNYLFDSQEDDGSWIHHPAVTGLAIIALYNSGDNGSKALKKEAIEKGLAFIRKFVQKDGSIWMAGKEKEYPNYTTAVSLCALATVAKPEDEAIMRKARKFLIGSQVADKKSKNFGGIGYGKSGPGNPDLSNTQWALEALYLTDYLDKEPKAKSQKDTEKSELAWKNAVQFLGKLQHVPETNDDVWVVKDKNDPNYGSFIYKTNESKAGQVEGKKTLRGYGSMTYAGLKSMIYARLDKNDPRVQAAVLWGSKNYTMDENPGMGPQGLFYYLHTFAKANAVLGDDTITSPDGKKHLWRVDLITKLLSLQKGNGSWINEKSGRWWESIPQLTTSYALMTMEIALGSKILKK
jgi:squalene-hopene/tetraprenyl-beta-curcumene cyclase